MRWILRSGIQQRCETGEFGGFHAWYDERQESYPYVYAETTGYALTALCGLGVDHAFRKQALGAAEWLSTVMSHENGAFRCLAVVDPLHPSERANRHYAFDNGIIVNGMSNVYRVTREPRWLLAAQRAAKWLVEAAQLDVGAFHPCFYPQYHELPVHEYRWSTRPGPYQSKIALGLLNVAELTGDSRLVQAARAVCEWSLRALGQRPTWPARFPTNLHPTCYAAEGLWAAGTLWNDARYVRRSADVTRWLLGRVINGSNGRERTDTLAQVLRLVVLHLQAGSLPREFGARARHLAAMLLGRRSVSGDPRANGGFYFTRSGAGPGAGHVNSWVTAFSIQALQLYRDHLDGRTGLHPFHLV